MAPNRVSESSIRFYGQPTPEAKTHQRDSRCGYGYRVRRQFHFHAFTAIPKNVFRYFSAHEPLEINCGGFIVSMYSNKNR